MGERGGCHGCGEDKQVKSHVHKLRALPPPSQKQHRMRRNENFKSARGQCVYIIYIILYSATTVLRFLKTYVRFCVRAHACVCVCLCERVYECMSYMENKWTENTGNRKKGQDTRAHPDNSILCPCSAALARRPVVHLPQYAYTAGMVGFVR